MICSHAAYKMKAFALRILHNHPIICAWIFSGHHTSSTAVAKRTRRFDKPFDWLHQWALFCFFFKTHYANKKRENGETEFDEEPPQSLTPGTVQWVHSIENDEIHLPNDCMWQLMAAVVGSWGYFCMGTSRGWGSPGLPSLNRTLDFEMDADDFKWICKHFKRLKSSSLSSKITFLYSCCSHVWIFLWGSGSEHSDAIFRS